MKDFLIFAAILIGWIALNRWILPLFGVQTCMSGACATQPRAETRLNDTSGRKTDGAPTTEDERPSSDVRRDSEDRFSAVK